MTAIGDLIGAANLVAAKWAAEHGFAWHGPAEDGEPWATLDERREIMRWSAVVIDLDGREVVVTDAEEDGITRGYGWTVIVDGEVTHGAGEFSEAGIREALGWAFNSREATPTRLFTTRDDAIAGIAAAIEGSGVIEDAAAAYDLDAIADEVLVWDNGYDAADDVIRLDRQGWLLVEGDAFWRAVERHERAD